MVVLGTTGWMTAGTTAHADAEKRESDLKSKKKYWRDLVEGGCATLRLMNTRGSA